jgi:hypothetical protein
VSGQVGWISKHLLANIALVPSLSLRSFPNSYLFFFFFFSLFFVFFLYLMICLEIILNRNPQTQHRFFSLFFSLFFSPTLHHPQNRPGVHRALRVWILSSHVVVVIISCIKT